MKKRILTVRKPRMVLKTGKYKDSRGRSAGMTMTDCNKLQVLQNSVNRLITGARQGTATTDLLDDTNSLSVQQMVAYYTLIMVHKITLTGKPAYLAERLSLRQENARELRGWGGRTVEISDYKFKEGVKEWVKDKIPVRPGR